MKTFNSIESAKQYIISIFSGDYSYNMIMELTFEARCYIEQHWGYKSACCFIARNEKKYDIYNK